jgi:hypothetical protein
LLDFGLHRFHNMLWITADKTAMNYFGRNNRRIIDELYYGHCTNRQQERDLIMEYLIMNKEEIVTGN